MYEQLVHPALQSPRSPLAVNSYGYLIVRWAKRRLGIELSDWQAYSLERMLEYDASGNLLARMTLISVGRQNGKSVIVRAFIGWILDEGYKHPAFKDWDLILLAAHDANQARIPYDYVRRDLESYADVSGWGHTARRKGIERSRATMYGGIEHHGVRVTVASRHAGATRGVSAGMVAWDEVLTQTDDSMFSVLQPAIVAIRNSQILMTSTAGFADSVVLRQQFDRLYRQSTGAEQHDPSFMGLWWRSDDDDVGLDWDQIRKANPSLDDGRLSRQMIAGEFVSLSRGSWVRERLNRWHDERVDAPFSMAAWGACRDPNPLGSVEGKYTIGVDVQSTWLEGSILVSAMRKDGRVGVEVHRHLVARPNVPLSADDFIREIVSIASKFQIENIVYSASSALTPALEKLGVERGLPCIAVPSTQMVMACHDFAEAVTSHRVAHDDPFLDSEVNSAQRRFVGSDGGWRWVITGKPATSVVASTIAVAYADKAVAPLQVFI